MLNKIIRFFKYLICMLMTLPRDFKGYFVMKSLKRKSAHYDKTRETVTDVFQKWVKKQPNKACIIFNDVTWTFQDFENYGNKIANLFADRYKLKKGDVVALFMENRHEHPAIWYGLSKLGVITALINIHLRTKALIHSIEVAQPKILIYDEELEDAIMEVNDQFSRKFDLIRQGQTKTPCDKAAGLPQLEKLLGGVSDQVFSPKEHIHCDDILMYIYTSGTTGLPKPAIIKHGRYISGGFTFFEAAGFNENDVFYVTLPVYHSNAGILGLGATIISGATVVLTKKFSASNFFKVAIKYKCTGFSFVGEVCRYLLNQPESPLDKQHSIRACVGNGMRANIHKRFTERFNIKCVEIYGATEGNCVLINTVGKYGACGYIPLINDFHTILAHYIIKVDQDYNPIRDKNGFCIKCDFNEKGLMVGVIGSSTKESFSGYANQNEQSNKKIIENLFKPGQRGFNTGDILVRDWFGYVYFVDRIGDTYRWRGENVSTIEVENIISARIDSKEVVAYGVEIPEQEGRAGMVTITDKNIDVEKLGEHIKKDLTSYAKPLFIRLEDNVDHTGSQKAQKNRLVQEGYNVNLFKSKTFYFDIKEQKYKELTKDIYEKIIKKQVKF